MSAPSLKTTAESVALEYDFEMTASAHVPRVASWDLRCRGSCGLSGNWAAMKTACRKTCVPCAGGRRFAIYLKPRVASIYKDLRYID